MSERLYLYLARRDRTDVKVVAVLSGSPRSGRVHDLESLSLPPQLHEAVSRVVHDNRMYWEPWVDAAPSFRSLRETLYKRGFHSLPFTSDPIVPMTGRADTSSMPVKRVMVRKPAT